MAATSSEHLAIIRGAYAKHVMAAARATSDRVRAAFADVPREDFLGPGPWSILRWGQGYVATPDDDPTYVYDDVLVAIDADRQLNNGQPSFHFKLFAALDPAPAGHVVHIGAGTGYYSALLAQLVGPAGRVTAIEYDGGLAARARANLAGWPQARVIEGDGAEAPFEPADGIYVNAGATHPLDHWLDRLRDGGRLILPLTIDRPLDQLPQVPLRLVGAVFSITRRGDHYGASWLSPVGIFPCVTARDPGAAAALKCALAEGGFDTVTTLFRHEGVPDERCWLRGRGWCLARD